jgi:hypothetical protein
MTDKAWLKEKLLEELMQFDDNPNMRTVYETGIEDGIMTAINLIEKLDEPEQTDTNVGLLKPVIPKFVADWIDTHSLYGNNPLREYRDLEIDFNEGWTDEKDAEVYHWVNKNPYAFIDALRYGCEVEEEKNYRFKTGDKYIRFNLDGTMMGSTKQNATISKERLEKLPFDVEKAVVSGVVILEEVNPCN